MIKLSAHAFAYQSFGASDAFHTGRRFRRAGKLKCDTLPMIQAPICLRSECYFWAKYFSSPKVH